MMAASSRFCFRKSYNQRGSNLVCTVTSSSRPRRETILIQKLKWIKRFFRIVSKAKLR